MKISNPGSELFPPTNLLLSESLYVPSLLYHMVSMFCNLLRETLFLHVIQKWCRLSTLSARCCIHTTVRCELTKQLSDTAAVKKLISDLSGGQHIKVGLSIWGAFSHPLLKVTFENQMFSLDNFPMWAQVQHWFYGTWYSHAVCHLSTNQAQPCLTSDCTGPSSCMTLMTTGQDDRRW